MTTKRTHAQLIEACRKMTNGKDYTVVTRSAEFVDEHKHLPRRLVFTAVEFTSLATGERCFISEMFL
jgi:hypothetical protein